MLYFCGRVVTSIDYSDASFPYCRLRAKLSFGVLAPSRNDRFHRMQIEQEMKAQNLNKTTMASAAAVLEKKLKVGLRAA